MCILGIRVKRVGTANIGIGKIAGHEIHLSM